VQKHETETGGHARKSQGEKRRNNKIRHVTQVSLARMDSGGYYVDGVKETEFPARRNKYSSGGGMDPVSMSKAVMADVEI